MSHIQPQSQGHQQSQEHHQQAPNQGGDASISVAALRMIGINIALVAMFVLFLWLAYRAHKRNFSYWIKSWGSSGSGSKRRDEQEDDDDDDVLAEDDEDQFEAPVSKRRATTAASRRARR